MEMSFLFCRILWKCWKWVFQEPWGGKGSQCTRLLLGLYVNWRFRASQLQVRKWELQWRQMEPWISQGSCAASYVKWCTSSWSHHSPCKNQFPLVPSPRHLRAMHRTAYLYVRPGSFQAPRLWIYSFACENSKILSFPDQDLTAES